MISVDYMIVEKLWKTMCESVEKVVIIMIL
jgi:hypothetical protein